MIYRVAAGEVVEISRHKRASFDATFDTARVSRAENKLIQRQRLDVPMNEKGLKGSTSIDGAGFNSQCLSSIRNS